MPAGSCGVRPGDQFPPSRSDWGKIDPDDLDANWAFKQFFGKSFADAEALFSGNALYYQEDLQSMPEVPFNFYAPALANYLRSPQAAGDSDGASSFLHMLCWMLESRPEVIAPETERMLLDAAQHIAENQGFYDADIDIYGRFSDLYRDLRDRADHGR